MKRILLHWGGAVLVIGMLSTGCETGAVPSNSSLAEQDSLLNMVKGEIAQKKLREQEVENFRRRQLPRNYSEQLKKYFPIIRKYSKRYGMDWRLIISLILKESHFKENARSHVGAMGLMQIMPRTAREITRELDIAYISKDPVENITAGIYHLYKQLQYFPEADPVNQMKLALAAYNCGPARVFDAQDIARFRRQNPNTWEPVRQALQELTSDDWKLHLEVWEQGVPRYGYFYGYNETVNYVDDIFTKYDIMQHMYKFDPNQIDFEGL